MDDTTLRLPEFCLFNVRSGAEEVLPWHPAEPLSIAVRAAGFICRQLRLVISQLRTRRSVTSEMLEEAARQVLEELGYLKYLPMDALRYFYTTFNLAPTP